MLLSLAALVTLTLSAKAQTCTNGSYQCSGQSLQQCAYQGSGLSWVTITTCTAGNVCSLTTYGCVPGTAPSPTKAVTTTAKTTTATTTTTNTVKTTTSVKQVTTTTTTTTTSKIATSTTGGGNTGLPGCYIAWASNQAYNTGSKVSLNNVNYVSKWYENAGANPATNADGGWTKEGACDPTKPVPTGTGGGGGGGNPPVATTLAQAQAYAASLSQDPGLLLLKSQVRTNPNVDSITPGNPSNPSNVKRVERIVTPSKWSTTYFSMADPVYTYTNFLKSVGFFAGFCDDYPGKDSDAICKRLLATMFAHFAQETGAHDKKTSIGEWQQSLVYVRELTCTETNTISGCYYNNDCVNPAFNKIFPCGKGPNNGYKAYFGRGAHQLSYSFNYGPFSQVMFNGDPTVLLNNPEQVADTWLNLASAIFFFIYPQPPKPSMLGVMDGTWVANAADKAAECAGSSTSNAARNRISYYKSFAADMGLDVSKENFVCAGMPAFDSSSSSSYKMYWTGSYLNQGECQLVNYQTNFNALMDGPSYSQYVKCVESTFNIKLK
ncbi:lysozyme-like domain-containing protein [Obelidium mucronatum]|nr:lysozyme-like domain-containing protein [Obelidium mucronatum]